MAAIVFGSRGEDARGERRAEGVVDEAVDSAIRYETDRFRNRSRHRFSCGTPGCCPRTHARTIYPNSVRIVLTRGGRLVCYG